MKQATRTDHEERIAVAISFILEHLDDSIDLRTVADEAGISRFHFHRIFQALIGETVGEVIRRLRLERSAKQLRQTDMPITRIALEAGYATHEAFIRSFRSAFGCTPSTFRRGRDYSGALPAPSGLHFGCPCALRFLIPTGVFTMQIETREISARPALCLPHKGPYFMIGGTFDRLFALLQEKGITQQEGVALYYDDPEATPPDQLRSDAGVFVADDVVVDDAEAHIVTVEGGRYAVATYIGPYDGLGHAWNEFGTKGIAARGYTMRQAPSFEVYVNDCNQVAPSELRTDLYIPIQ